MVLFILLLLYDVLKLPSDAIDVSLKNEQMSKPVPLDTACSSTFWLITITDEEFIQVFIVVTLSLLFL